MAKGGHLCPFHQTSADASGHDHEVSVPFDKAFQFVLKPVHLAVANGNSPSGPPVAPNGLSVAMVHASNGPPPTPLIFTVTGKQGARMGPIQSGSA